jgi:hypothetical protein
VVCPLLPFLHKQLENTKIGKVAAVVSKEFKFRTNGGAFSQGAQMGMIPTSLSWAAFVKVVLGIK